MFTGLVTDIGEVAAVADHPGGAAAAAHPLPLTIPRRSSLGRIHRLLGAVPDGRRPSDRGTEAEALVRGRRRGRDARPAPRSARGRIGHAGQPGALAEDRRRTRRASRDRPRRRRRRDVARATTVDEREAGAGARRRGSPSARRARSPASSPKRARSALDGTSLTVNTVEGDTFSVLLIPHTLAVTTWGERRAGDRLNLEVDLMARYAARLAEAAGEGY